MLSILVDIAQIATFIGLMIALRQFAIARRQLYFASISRCVSEFQALDITTIETSERKIRKYVDLVGEELFYFQNGYIPKAVAIEWIDGMLGYIPVTDGQGIVVNEGHSLTELVTQRDRYLRGYPRIRSAFTLRGQHDWQTAFGENINIDLRGDARRAIAEETYQNVKNYTF